MAKETGQVFNADQTNLLRQSLKLITLAEDVYLVDGKKAPAGWKLVANAPVPPQGGNGFFAKVYEKTGPLPVGEARYVVAFRGTDTIREVKDLDSSFRILFRKLPSQYNQGVAFVKKFCETHNVKPEDIELTGHSLGGYLGITIGMTLGTGRVWAFNSPGPSKEIRDELSNKIPGISKSLCCKGLVQVRSRYDVISKWQYPEGKIIDIETVGSNHALLSLKEGIEAVVSGQPLKPIAPAKRSLTTIFNDISKRLAESGPAGRLINGLLGGNRGAPPKPPGCACG